MMTRSESGSEEKDVVMMTTHGETIYPRQVNKVNAMVT